MTISLFSIKGTVVRRVSVNEIIVQACHRGMVKLFEPLIDDTKVNEIFYIIERYTGNTPIYEQKLTLCQKQLKSEI